MNINPPLTMNLDRLGHLMLDVLCHQLTATTHSQLAKLTETEWQHLTALAKEHMVASLLYTRVQQHGIEAMAPLAVQQSLQQAQHQVALCNLHFYHQLHQIIDRAQAQEMPLILLKGAHLAAAVYPTIDQRAMTDLDLLVEQEYVPAFVTILYDLGYQPITPLHDYATHFAGAQHHLPRFAKAQAPTIEIHWMLSNADNPQRWAMDGLRARAQMIAVQNRNALGLAAEDLLLHVCLHATNHHLLRQGVRFLCDIDAIVQRYDGQPTSAEQPRCLDWSVVVERSKAIGGARGFYLALVLAQQLLGTPIPSAVLSALVDRQIDDVTLQALAQNLFVDDRTLLRTISPNFMRLDNRSHLFDRLRYLWRRLFISRQRLALKYTIDADSPQLYLYYLVRLKDLIARHFVSRRRLQHTEPKAAQAATQQGIFLHWLEGTNR